MSTSCRSFEDLKGWRKAFTAVAGYSQATPRRYIPTSQCIGKLNRSYSYKLCVLGSIKIILLLRRHYHISIILLKSSCTSYYLSLSPHSGCVIQLTNREMHFFPVLFHSLIVVDVTTVLITRNQSTEDQFQSWAEKHLLWRAVGA